MEPTNNAQQAGLSADTTASAHNTAPMQRVSSSQQAAPAQQQAPVAQAAPAQQAIPMQPMASAAQPAPEKRSGLLGNFISLVVMVAVVVIVVMLLRTFVFLPYKIPSASMEDTIMTGDMVFSEKVSYYGREPGRGDIVTFADPLVAGRTLIKRVIATEGETVDLVDGYVVVDGETLDEPYTQGKPSYPLERTAEGKDVTFPYTVPEGYVWVMGDNRDHSQDSRYFGAVPRSTIDGRAAMIYWPIGHIGMLS